MNIDLKKTLKAIERCLSKNTTPDLAELKRAYRHTIQLQSQLLAVVYDIEMFGGIPSGRRFALEQSAGENSGDTVTLTIAEPMPSMKKLTEAVEEHWKAMVHSAIAQAARQDTLPYFQKAFVEIEVITARGSNNARLWDTSNRAINVIINNLKGIFFEDDSVKAPRIRGAPEKGAKKQPREQVNFRGRRQSVGNS